jgi:hypothetical protein
MDARFQSESPVERKHIRDGLHQRGYRRFDIFPDNEVAKLGFASAFYNQIQSNNRFLNISSNGLPGANNFVDFGPNWLGFSGDRHALDFLPTLTYIKGAHTIRAGVNVNFQPVDNPVGGNADNFNFSSNFTNEFGGGTANNSDAPGYSSGCPSPRCCSGTRTPVP